MFREASCTTRKYSKSAGVGRRVLKKYHPHGDSAVYDTMVRMAQDSTCVIRGGRPGELGSIDGDSAAAYRYTEARLTKLAEETACGHRQGDRGVRPELRRHDRGACVLPRVPNLLINGSAALPWGWRRTSRRTIQRVVDGLVMMIDNPEVTIRKLMTAIKGPDFPTAGFIMAMKASGQAYMTGRGIVQCVRRVTIEEGRRPGEHCHHRTSLPGEKARLLQTSAGAHRDKKINGIAGAPRRIRPTRHARRWPTSKRRDRNVILNQLYKHTALQSTFASSCLRW